MLYLEDYLEMIEHLPQELRDRFTDMRELDLSVQNNMDSFEKRIRVLFSQCRRGEVQGAQADNEFFAIRRDYYKALEDADEKVQLANQMYDLVDRYLRRLDSELFKFKCELEADNNGITEILEKRSLEMDGTSSNSNHLNATSQKENRYFGLITSASSITSNNHHPTPMTTPSSASSTTTTRERYRPKPEKRRNSSSSAATAAGHQPEKRQNITSTVTIATSSSLPPPSAASTIISVRPTTPTTAMVLPTVATPTQPATVSYNLQHIGAGNAIAAAASQAIAATQQMQQGRRTASLKASYEAIHGTTGGNAHELLIGRELAGAAHNAIQAVEREGSTFNQSQRRHKKKITAIASLTQPTSSPTINQAIILPPSPVVLSQPIITTNITNAADSPSIILNDNGLVVEQTPEGEWTYDPNEPRYCTCNQVSYGDMVACDNEACPFEWFHYPCVGITQSPKGKWYCPKCTSSMKRRGSRK